VPRKRARIPVVFDTNLFVTRFIKHDRHGINRRVMDLWQSQRKLQLIISPPVKREYLRVLEAYAGIAPDVLKLLEARLDTASYVTQVNLGTRFRLSRDATDNKFLDTARVGKAKYLVSRDRDLLDIPKADLRGLRFEIVTPLELLQELGELSSFP
jgi:putative PIN family toxin of toxin-antitoxin system